MSRRIARSRGPAGSATTAAPGSWPTAVWPCCPRAQRWASPTRRSGRGRPRAPHPRPASRRSGPTRSRRSAALPTAPPSSRSGTGAPTSSRISSACGRPAGMRSCGPLGSVAWFRAALRSQRCGPPAPWAPRASGPRPARRWSAWPGASLSFWRPATAPGGARRSGSGACGSGTTGSRGCCCRRVRVRASIRRSRSSPGTPGGGSWRSFTKHGKQDAGPKSAGSRKRIGWCRCSGRWRSSPFRLLTLRDAARRAGTAPADAPAAALKVLAAKLQRPAECFASNRAFLRGVAQLGGFLARTSDGEPGWQTLWKGWSVLMTLVEGCELAQTIGLRLRPWSGVGRIR
jgi:hypothetical protein